MNNEQVDIDASEFAGHHEAVSFLELFFDLVYVYAISQLSEHLVENLTWTGALQTLIMLLTVFTVWSFTAYESTMVLARNRTANWVVLAVMLLGMIMNTSITVAFEDGPWTFVIPMLAIQFGRTAMTRVYDVYPQFRLHRIHMIIWAAVSGVPWVIGGFAEPEHRLWWWLLAMVIDVAGMWLGHPMPRRRQNGVSTSVVRSNPPVRFDADHMIERCQLFLIICLGEGIVTTGNSMLHHLHEPIVIIAGVLSVMVLTGLWYIFFGARPTDLEELGLPHNELVMGQLATRGQQVLMIGLVAYAVGAELMVDEPLEHMSPTQATLGFGGVVICVVSLWIYLAIATGRKIWPEFAVGSLVLLIAWPLVILLHIPAVVGLAILVIVLVVMVFYGARTTITPQTQA